MSEYTKKLVKVNVARFIDHGIDSHTTAVVTIAMGNSDDPSTEYMTLILHNWFDNYCVSIYRTDEHGDSNLMIEADEEVWEDGDLCQGWYNLQWYQDEDESVIEYARKLEGGIPEFLQLVSEYYQEYAEHNKWAI